MSGCLDSRSAKIPFYAAVLLFSLVHIIAPSLYGGTITSYHLQNPVGPMDIQTSGEGGGGPNQKVQLTAPQVVVAMASYPQTDGFWNLPFIWSLRCTGYNGDIVLIVRPELHESPPPELAAFFQAMGVTTQPVGADMEGVMCPAEDKLAEQKSLDPRCMPPEFSRYYEYQRALSRYQDPNTRVLLVDYRDTIFQADPFSMPELEGDLRVMAEMPYELMGPGYWMWTSWWMSHCFGENAAKMLDEKFTLCSGTVMGTKRGMGRYLERMLDAMSKLGMKENCRVKGQDQGYHNYLYYTGALGPGEVLLPGRSQVYTIGRFCSGPKKEVNSTMIASAERGFIIENEDGRLAPVVHQIDRCTAPHYHGTNHQVELLKRCPSITEELKKVRTPPLPAFQVPTPAKIQ